MHIGRHHIFLTGKWLDASLLTILLFILSLVEGINGLDMTPTLKKRQDQTPTFDSSSPTSSPFLLLRNFGSSLTTCTPINITWAYAGPPLPLELIATNIGVIPPSSQVSRANTFTDGQVLAVPSGISQPQPTQISITQGILPQASAVPWNVNVPAGWYQIVASFHSIFEDQTDPFLVQLGTNTSCLLGGSLTANVRSPSSTSTKSISATLFSGAGESATSRLLKTTDHKTHAGIIAGLSSGLVTIIAVVMLLFWWRRRCMRNRISMPVQVSAYGILDESPGSLVGPPNILLGGVLHISQGQNLGSRSNLGSMSGENLMIESVGSDSRLSHSTITAPTLPSYRSRATEPPQYRYTSSDISGE